MNKIVFLYLFWLLPMVVVSQAESEVALDSLYREDQIYIGVTYNTFIQAPESLSQTNFSPGFKVGLIRDFPINSKRNIAIGLGAGYALNAYVQIIKRIDFHIRLLKYLLNFVGELLMPRVTNFGVFTVALKPVIFLLPNLYIGPKIKLK